jgi:hypothetical protein
MDVKFRQYVDKTVDGFTFSGSYPQVHFNVFCVRLSIPTTTKKEVNIYIQGAFGFLSITILHLAIRFTKVHQGVIGTSLRSLTLIKVAVNLVNWITFLVGYLPVVLTLLRRC